MYPSTISILAFAGVCVAQTSVVSLYIPGADTQPLVASIVGSDASATTYAVQCSPGTDGSDCGIAGGITLVEGPSTAGYNMTDTDFTGTIGCSLASASAVCIESFGGSAANDPGVSTVTYTGTDYSSQAVTVTAGAVASTGGASATSTTSNGASTATKTSKLSGTSAKTSSSSGTGSSSGLSTAISASSTSTGGMPAVTGNCRWAIGGAAVALAAMV